MSGTPNPDSVISEWDEHDKNSAADVARQLYRELTAAEERIKRLEERLGKIAIVTHCGGLANIDPYVACVIVRVLAKDDWDREADVDDIRNRLVQILKEAKP